MPVFTARHRDNGQAKVNDPSEEAMSQPDRSVLSFEVDGR